jgi:hypothetical protein
MMNMITTDRFGEGDASVLHRPRPTRADLLALIASNGRALRKADAICQSHCSHCYAGHCGSGCGSSVETAPGRSN